MKKFCKIISLLIIGWFIATTIPVNNLVDNVKADEVVLDTDFIDDVLEDLTSIANQDTYWTGRDFGYSGEWEARDDLIDKWHNHISIINNIEDADYEKIVKEEGDGIDDKILVSDYSLKRKIGNEWDEIDKQSCFPVPTICKLNINYNEELEYEAVLTPLDWYKSAVNNIEFEQEQLDSDLKEKKILYETDCMLLNDAGGLCGEVVYIEDYDNSSMDLTNGTVHLIEIGQNANDDVFNDTVEKVFNSGGTSFIAMITNPSFINNSETSVTGVVISRYDGEIIKQEINNQQNVFAEFEGGTSSNMGKLRIYKHEQPEKLYIYIIDNQEIVDRYTLKNLFKGFYPRTIDIVNFTYYRSREEDCDKPASAFLIYDINSDYTFGETHFMVSASSLRGDLLFDKGELYHQKMAGFITSYDIGKPITDGQKIKFKIVADLNEKIESYNVIGTIPCEKSDDVIIVCGHHDSYWGQCAIDNAVGSAGVWGVAKYFSDNYFEIKDDLDFDLKFISFTGEEGGLRGAYYYVWKHVLNNEKEKVVAVIDFDSFAQNLKEIPFTPWIYPPKKENRKVYNNILNILRTYKNNDYNFEDPATHGRNRFYTWSDAAAFKHGNDVYTDCVVALERWPYWPFTFSQADDFREPYYISYWDHRSGDDFQKGDILDKVDRADLYRITEIAVNLVKYYAIDMVVNFDNDCTFTQLDLDSDGNYDSVRIDFDVTTNNLSSLGTVESIFYQNGQPKSSAFTTDPFNITFNQTISGNLTVTLPSNVTAGNYVVEVFLNDINGTVDDIDNTTVYLYPFNNSIANFTWEINDNNLKMVNFTDCSASSPGATINSWNWSFGDGYYSLLQNCSHNYSSIGFFNVTLSVTDSVNKSANVTQQIEVSNTPPVAMFNVNSTLILVNKSISFNSTSYDVDGNIENTTWIFGDNITGYGSNITHYYNRSGFYTIAISIIDNDNFTGSAWKTDHILVVDALVDDNFVDDPVNHSWNTIQKGINDVSDNGTIYVYNGLYQPYLVNKSISIYGESKDDVQLRLLPFNIGINVQSHDVFIKNFTITGGGWIGVNIISTINGTGNTIVENGAIFGPITYGIYIDNSTNNTIKNCSIEKANVGIKICNGAKYNIIDNCVIKGCYNGVGIYSSSYNWVGNPSVCDWYPNDCEFSLNTNAVYIDESDHNYILGCEIDASPPTAETSTKGIYLDESSNTTISTCKIFNSTHQGIYIKDSRDSKVEFCCIVDNNNGIECFGDDALCNLIVQNNISGNSNYGVYIPPFPQGNKVFYNDFFYNGNVFTNQSYDDGPPIFGEPNKWCKVGGTLLTKNGRGEGNYWNDYTGSDLNQDGIGDIEYGIDGFGNEDDDYPLMEAYGWCSNWE